MISRLNAFDPVDIRQAGPVSQRIAASIRAAITARRVLVGQRLPTQSELAAHFRVARETVKRALRMLQAEGLVVSRQGKGAFVAIAAHHESDSVAAQKKATCPLLRGGGGCEVSWDSASRDGGARSLGLPICTVIVIHQTECLAQLETGDSLYGLTSATGCEAVAVYLARWQGNR